MKELNPSKVLDAMAASHRPASSRPLPEEPLAVLMRTGYHRYLLVALGCMASFCGGRRHASAAYPFSPPPLSRHELAEPAAAHSQPLTLIQRLPFTTEVVDADQYLDLSGSSPSDYVTSAWHWQYLPPGIIYHSYMASVHESRLSGIVLGDGEGNALLDVALGGRVGILRYGTADDLRPEGWQLDLEGAGFPRLALDHNWDVEAVDFRIGVPLTYGIDNWRYKFSYYHLSSHLGDEFAIRNDGSLSDRINYSRDALVLGVSWYPRAAWRLYAEADWAFHFDDGSQPWEFLLGVDYAQPGPTGVYGTPFFALNGHLREAVDFGGNLVVQTGWLWRGMTGHTLRMGFHYYNGKSSQFEFFDEFEQQIGFGIWYDQ